MSLTVYHPPARVVERKMRKLKQTVEIAERVVPPLTLLAILYEIWRLASRFGV